MNGRPVSILFSPDSKLRQRLHGYLSELSCLRLVHDPSELKLMLQQHSAVLLFIDLLGTDCIAWLPLLRRDFPDTVIVALGDARSDPGLMAVGAGIYGIEDAAADRSRIQTLFEQVQMQLRLRMENRMLRDQLQQAAASCIAPRETIAPPPFYPFTAALRRFDKIEAMLEQLVESVSASLSVPRVAVFLNDASGPYRFRAGVKCLPQTRTLAFNASDPLVLWLQLHAHSIYRAMLQHAQSIDARDLLETSLDLHGAEIIMPLFGRDRLMGWLCLGRPSSGVPFEPGHIEDLSMVAEQVSVTIENALLHDNLSVQKALAENLLQAIPAGIIAAGPEGMIRWFNSGAEQLLQVKAETLIEQPVRMLSATIAALLNRCMAGEREIGPIEWTEPLTGRELALQARRLQQQGLCLGAMVVLQDLTEERLFHEKQNNLERAEFWNELASAISHEIRNPLVAISTFAQLLPERYAEEEFRTQFRDLTTREVGRLNAMIDQLDLFAHPPTLRFVAVEAPALLNSALCKARAATGSVLEVGVEAASDLPPLRADADVLTDSIAHLLDNAFAAVAETVRPRITLRACRGEIGAGRLAVMIEVRDNGHGIPEDLKEKIYSPFCTGKARGVGLGLAIVRRTMIDHEGLVDIESSATGTRVQLTLPVYMSHPESSQV